MIIPSLPRRYLVAGLAGVGLLSGGVVVAEAATTSAPAAPSGTPTGTASAPARPATPPAHRPHLDGTVTGAVGDTITIKDHDGFTRSIDVTSSTKYTLDGKASTGSAVTKGRFVHADGTVDANGTSLDATTVAVLTSAPKPGAPGPGARGPGGRGRGGRGPAGLPKPPAGSKAPSPAPS